ncbi:unnamed protein product [Lasius platythorax]|uniref:THAP-type domain-containing protein n=1 Tax=Lasius platythorax TaxID=488582 RepID=A0AAV2NN68_9HYME
MPKNPEERKKWLERMGLNNEDVPENAKLCSLHFEESAFDRRDDYYIRIRPGVIPFGNASVSNIEAPKKKQKVLDTRNQENIVAKTIVQDNSDCHFIETVQNNSDIPGTVTIDSIIISTSSTSEVIDAVSQSSTPRKVKHQGTAVSPRLSEDTPRKQTLRIALINTRKHYNKKIKSLRQKHRKFVKCIANLKDVLKDVFA